MICLLCQQEITERQPMHGWPDFLPPGHALSRHSGGVYHRACASHPDNIAEMHQVRDLHKRYMHVWHYRPRRVPDRTGAPDMKTKPVSQHLRGAELPDHEREAWHVGALQKMWREHTCTDHKEVSHDGPGDCPACGTGLVPIFLVPS